MRSVLRIFVPLIVIAAGACGSDVPEPEGTDGGGGAEGADGASTRADGEASVSVDAAAACTGTVTGTVTSSFECQVVFTNERELRFIKTPPRNDVVAQLFIRTAVDQPFAARAYRLEDFSSASVHLLLHDGTQYVASAGVPDASLDLTITAIGALGPSSPTTHGMLAARVAETNAEAGIGSGRADITLRF